VIQVLNAARAVLEAFRGPGPIAGSEQMWTSVAELRDRMRDLDDAEFRAELEKPR
jgi:hypothetical protein